MEKVIYADLIHSLGKYVKDILRKLATLNCPSDYYQLMIFQAGNDEISTRNQREIKKDFRTLGRMVKGSSVQVLFASISPLAVFDEGMNRKSQQINAWLQDWCDPQDTGFFSNKLL